MILIIDDDSAIRSSLSFMLKRAKYEVQAVPGPKEAMEAVRSITPQLILMDMNFSLSTDGAEGLLLLKQVKLFCPDVPVILMTAWGSIPLAVQGMRAGAFDFITKPWNNAALMQRIETALELTEKEEAAGVSVTEAEDFDRSHIIGKSKALEAVLATVKRVSRTSASVLVTGESGTGKELIAEAIHLNSPRRNQPFVKVNLGGISQTLFESEMFGHKKGAFTDARKAKPGRMEIASGGTLFLDEIGNLSMPMQAKLLTAIEKKQITRLGSLEPINIDVRLICATNANIAQLISEGAFRQDLLYRINTIELHVPPLRERGEDILLLADYFLTLYNRKYRKDIQGITREAKNKLLKYLWPGNVRELQHMLERAVILSENRLLRANDFLFSGINSKEKPQEDLNLENMEKKTIKRAIELSEGNLNRAADLLGITRFSLYRKIEKLGL